MLRLATCAHSTQIGSPGNRIRSFGRRAIWLRAELRAELIVQSIKLIYPKERKRRRRKQLLREECPCRVGLFAHASAARTDRRTRTHSGKQRQSHRQTH